MKIEGIQYPLPAKRILSRGSESSESANSSDDAVYFEPDEKQREKQRQQQDQKSSHEELAAQVEIRLLTEEPVEVEVDAIEIEKSGVKKPEPRAVDVLA